MPLPPVSSPPSRSRFPDVTLPGAILLLLLVILCFEVWFPWDLVIQDLLYVEADHRWLIRADAPWPRLLFYSGPKHLIMAFGFGLLATLFIRPERRPRWLRWLPDRRVVGVTVMTLALTPLATGVLKATTGVHCPWSIKRYGGEQPYVRLFESPPPDAPAGRRGKCWPSGHASGGFALFSLAGWSLRRRMQWLGIAAGTFAGGIMGAYQMAKGAHYLSHVLVTALLGWILFLISRRLLGVAERRASAN